jgi:O-antigen/teichoic acid export membrane protein
VLTHAFRYLIGQGVARGMIHFFTLALAKVLSSEDFVAFSFFLISANVYSRIANGSLNMVMARMRFGGEASERATRQSRIYRFSTLFGLVLTFVLVAAELSFGFSARFHISSEVLCLSLISGYLVSVENNLIEVLQSRFESVRYMKYMLSFTALLLVFAFAGRALFPDLTARTLMVAYGLAQLVVLVFFQGFKFAWPFQFSEIRAFARIGSLVCLYGVSTYLFRYLEVMIANRYIDVEQMAAFMFAFRLMESLNLLILAVGAVITPTIYLGLQELGWNADQQRKISIAIWLQMISFSIFASVLPYGVQFFEPRFLPTLALSPLLLGSILLVLMIGIAQAFVLYYDRYKEMVIVSLCGLAVATLLGFLMAPLWGPAGILVAKLVSQLVVLLGYILTVRRYPVHFWSLKPIPWLLGSGVLVGVVFLFYRTVLSYHFNL